MVRDLDYLSNSGLVFMVLTTAHFIKMQTKENVIIEDSTGKKFEF